MIVGKKDQVRVARLETDNFNLHQDNIKILHLLCTLMNTQTVVDIKHIICDRREQITKRDKTKKYIKLTKKLRLERL